MRRNNKLKCCSLYSKIFCQLCLFTLSLVTCAAFVQFVENDDNRLSARNNTINSSKNSTNKALSYTQALGLALSAFTTVGWECNRPRTGLGKLVLVFSSLIGIPLTILLAIVGGRLIIRHCNDFIEIFLAMDAKIHQRNKYSDHKCRLQIASIARPVLVFLLFTHVSVTSAIVSYTKRWLYADSLWFVFSVLSTNGFGNSKNGSFYQEAGLLHNILEITYSLFWILFGYSTIAAILMMFTELRSVRASNIEWNLTKSFKKFAKKPYKKPVHDENVNLAVDL